MKDVIRLAWILGVLALVPLHLLGQTTQGEILGSVTDETDRLIPGAEVTVRSLDTGLTRTTISDDRGFYSVPHLEPSRYSVEVALPGFKKYIQSPVVLDTGRKLRVNVKLEIGEFAEEVLVESETPVIDADPGTLSASVDQDNLRMIVMGGRGVFNFRQLIPGGTAGNLGTQISGTRGTAADHTIDGVSVINAVDGNTVSSTRPDLEVVRETRFNIVNNSAEFGRLSTIFVTTMSGSNDFQGQASYNQHIE